MHKTLKDFWKSGFLEKGSVFSKKLILNAFKKITRRREHTWDTALESWDIEFFENVGARAPEIFGDQKKSIFSNFHFSGARYQKLARGGARGRARIKIFEKCGLSAFKRRVGNISTTSSYFLLQFEILR